MVSSGGLAIRVRVTRKTTYAVELSARKSQMEIPMLTILQFLHDDQGATAIEYGLIAAGIAVAIIAVVNGVGTKLTTVYQEVSDNLK